MKDFIEFQEDGGGRVALAQADIVALREESDDRTWIFLSSGNSFLMCRSLKDVIRDYGFSPVPRVPPES